MGKFQISLARIYLLCRTPPCFSKRTMCKRDKRGDKRIMLLGLPMGFDDDFDRFFRFSHEPKSET